MANVDGGLFGALVSLRNENLNRQLAERLKQIDVEENARRRQHELQMIAYAEQLKAARELVDDIAHFCDEVSRTYDRGPLFVDLEHFRSIENQLKIKIAARHFLLGDSVSHFARAVVDQGISGVMRCNQTAINNIFKSYSRSILNRDSTPLLLPRLSIGSEHVNLSFLFDEFNIGKERRDLASSFELLSRIVQIRLNLDQLEQPSLPATRFTRRISG